MEEPKKDTRMTPLQEHFQMAVVDICLPTWGPGLGLSPFKFCTPLTPTSQPASAVSPNATHFTSPDVEMVDVAEVIIPKKQRPAVTVKKVVDEDVLAAKQHHGGE